MDKYNKMRILFEQYSNSEKAIEMSKYMRNMFKFYGIPTPIRKSLYKDFLKGREQSKQVDWNFLNQCFQDEHREFQYLVYDYLIKLNKFLSYEDISKIENYIRNKQWWDTIDFFDQVIGTIGLNDPLMIDRIFNVSMVKRSKFLGKKISDRSPAWKKRENQYETIGTDPCKQP